MGRLAGAKGFCYKTRPKRPRNCMLDPKFVRENPDAVKEATRIKRVASPETVDQWLMWDEKRRHGQTEGDALKKRQRELGEQVARLKRELKGGTNAELDGILAETNSIKEQVKTLEEVQKAAEEQTATLMLQLPAIPDPSWPVGKDDKDNVVARHWEDPHHPPVKLEGWKKDHVALGKALNILDFDRGVKLAGSRSYVVRGGRCVAVLGCVAIRAGHAARARIRANGCAHPGDRAMYDRHGVFSGWARTGVRDARRKCAGRDERSAAGQFFGSEILDIDKPIKLCALSTCFRREAGAAGKDTAGLYRVHQFEKVEQVIIHKANDAEHIRLHEEIIENSEAILQGLKLPYRVTKNCTGDMGQGKWRMYDIETWMPSRAGFGGNA